MLPRLYLSTGTRLNCPRISHNPCQHQSSHQPFARSTFALTITPLALPFNPQIDGTPSATLACDTLLVQLHLPARHARHPALDMHLSAAPTPPGASSALCSSSATRAAVRASH